MNKITIAVIVLCIVAIAAGLVAWSVTRQSPARGCIAPISENVTVQRVHYKNRYGMKIAGNLYTARDIDKTKTYPALIVGAPYGGVKEQAPCVYANELAVENLFISPIENDIVLSNTHRRRRIANPDEVFATKKPVINVITNIPSVHNIIMPPAYNISHMALCGV